VFWVDTVKPDNGAARGHLGVDRPAAIIMFQYSGLEPERLHKETLSSFYVLVHSQRNDPLTAYASIPLRRHGDRRIPRLVLKALLHLEATGREQTTPLQDFPYLNRNDRGLRLPKTCERRRGIGA
jgi:hypothetical protein